MRQLQLEAEEHRKQRKRQTVSGLHRSAGGHAGALLAAGLRGAGGLGGPQAHGVQGQPGTPSSTSLTLLFRKLLMLPKLEKFPQSSFTVLPGILAGLVGNSVGPVSRGRVREVTPLLRASAWRAVLCHVTGGQLSGRARGHRETGGSRVAHQPGVEAARPSVYPHPSRLGTRQVKVLGPPCRSPAATTWTRASGRFVPELVKRALDPALAWPDELCLVPATRQACSQLRLQPPFLPQVPSPAGR